MSAAEKSEHGRLGEQLIIELGRLTVDVMLRSELPLDVNYTSIELSKIVPLGEEISLTILQDREEERYILNYCERRDVSEDYGKPQYDMTDSRTIDFNLSLDGTGLSFRHDQNNSSLEEEAIYLIGRLPELIGAEAIVEIFVSASS